MTTTPTQAAAELPALQAPHPALQDALFCYAAGEDGAHAVLIRGWPALCQKLREDCGVEATDEALTDIDVWSRDGDGLPYHFSLNFEGDWVAIYRVSYSRAKPPALSDEQIDALHDSMFPRAFLEEDRVKVRAFVRAALAAQQAEREPLTPDELADKCEAWLQSGGATNIVDAFEAGYRSAERAHRIGKEGA